MYLRELGADVVVCKNDEIQIADIEEFAPERLILSPGPGRPKAAGITLQAIEHFAEKFPILGVCLGHQCIAEHFGASIERNSRLMHGKVSVVDHDGAGVFKSLPNRFTAMRYHSLIIDEASLPDCLRVTAWSEYENPQSQQIEREVMAIEHTSLPLFGVQFHPESILSEGGHQLLKNFLET